MSTGPPIAATASTCAANGSSRGMLGAGGPSRQAGYPPPRARPGGERPRLAARARRVVHGRFSALVTTHGAGQAEGRARRGRSGGSEAHIRGHRARRLEGIRYASVKLEDGVTFLALLEVEDGVENPLPGLRRPRSSTTASRGGTPSRRRSDRERWSGPTRSSPTRSPRVEVRAGGLVPEVAVLDRCGRAATTSVVQPSPGWTKPSAEPVDGGPHRSPWVEAKRAPIAHRTPATRLDLGWSGL